MEKLTNKKEKKVHFDNNNIKIEFNTNKIDIEEDDIFPDFYRDLFNNYLEYFNKTNRNENKTLFYGINNNDKSATNKQLEQLYAEMHKYTEFKTTNKNLIEIVLFEKMDKLTINDDFEIYCIFKNGIPHLVSQSFFALLKELTDLKNEDNKNTYNLSTLD